MENQYFADNMVIYIEKKKLKNIVMIQLFNKFKNMKKRMTILFRYMYFLL